MKPEAIQTRGLNLTAPQTATAAQRAGVVQCPGPQAPKSLPNRTSGNTSMSEGLPRRFCLIASTVIWMSAEANITRLQVASKPTSFSVHTKIEHNAFGPSFLRSWDTPFKTTSTQNLQTKRGDHEGMKDSMLCSMTPAEVSEHAVEEEHVFRREPQSMMKCVA